MRLRLQQRLDAFDQQIEALKRMVHSEANEIATNYPTGLPNFFDTLTFISLSLAEIHGENQAFLQRVKESKRSPRA